MSHAGVGFQTSRLSRMVFVISYFSELSELFSGLRVPAADRPEFLTGGFVPYF